MKISTEINSIVKHVGFERAVRMVAEAGFDAWDFSMFSMVKYDREAKAVIKTGSPLEGDGCYDFARKLRKIGEDNGIHCNQSHAPFPVYISEIRSHMKRAIECTAIAGGKICVIHPDNFASAEKNAEMYLELLPFAKEHGVKIATENMWCWDKENDVASAAACSHHDDFLAHIKAVNDPYLVACLDLGHAEMRGLDTTAEKMIFTLGEHLQALHIHDNNQNSDSHLMPYVGSIFWKDFLTELKKVGYSGDLSFETCAQTSVNRVPRELTPVFLRTFHAIAAYFRTQLQ